MENKNIEKINNIGQSIFEDPLTFKKALLLCFFTEGILFTTQFIAYKFNLSIGLVPDILYLATVLLIARIMGKDELGKILVWRNIPAAVFASVLILFFGFEILMSEFRNLFQILLPIPEGFFSGMFYQPENVFIIIVSAGLFPGFSEEIFFRGIIARRFFRAYSPIKAILLSSLLFGIMHYNPWQAVNAFFGGIFIGWTYWRYRSIWLSMFIHAYYNVLVTLLPLPYTKTNSITYIENWRHPLWFIIL